jgi:cell division protein FtsQ
MSAVKPYSRPSLKRKKVQRPSTQLVGVRRFSSVAFMMSFAALFLWGYFHFVTLTTSVVGCIDGLMAHLGFTLEDVVVEGRMRTNKEQILHTLALKRGMPLLSVDLPEAKEKLENLSWVKAARVERRLPDTLFIRISEKEPVAIWQNQNKTYLVDDDGELLETQEAHKYKELLLVTGHQAPKYIGHLLALLEKFPKIKGRVTAATHLRSTRWDIKLDGQLDIKLPETETESALEYLLTLENNHHLTDQKIMTIDMRLPGQLILRLTPEASQKKNNMGKDA